MSFHSYLWTGNFLGRIADHMRKSNQKTALKQQLTEDIQSKKEHFKFSLKHRYALHNLEHNHQTLSNNITNHFDGQGKEALTSRIQENVQDAHGLNHEFEMFLSHF